MLHRHLKGVAGRARVLMAGGLLLGAVGASLALTLGSASATGGNGCGTLPSDNNVYINCASAGSGTNQPFDLYTDGQQLNISMGPNSAFANSGSGTDIEAIECEYNNGFGAPGDPPDDTFCNAQTTPSDFPYSTRSDGSFDYTADNSGDAATVFQLPDAYFQHSTITCDATHACVWFVGADYTNFNAAHFFSAPFYVVGSPPAFTSTSSDTVVAGSAFTFPVTAVGNPAPTITEVPHPPLPSGVTLTSSAPGTATLSGTSSVAPGTYAFTLQAASTASPTPATQSFVLTVLTQYVQVLSPAAAAGDTPMCNPGATCGTVTWTAFGIGNKYPVGSPGPFTWHAVAPGTNVYCSSATQGCLVHLPAGMKFKPLNHTTVELVMTPSAHAAAGTYSFAPQAEVTAKINGVATKLFANGPTYTITIP